MKGRAWYVRVLQRNGTTWTFREKKREKEISFKELPYAIMRTGRSEIRKAGGQARHAGSDLGAESSSSGKPQFCSLRLLSEAHPQNQGNQSPLLQVSCL